MSMHARLRVSALLAMTVAVVDLVLLWTFTAHGQAASQPASQPAVVGGFWAWVSANGVALVGLLINLLSTIATGLSDYPAETPAGASKLQKAVRIIRLVVACLGWAQFKNSPGSLKLLGAPAAKA
jgi:formate-dependent nitrite reductase membrane component NrfD